MSIKLAQEILKNKFGYDSFRMNQQAAIESVLAKKDCVVLMPTGGGKSVCYQVPALLSDGLTVVISPLIALMKDQVDALRLNGVEAAFLNSSLDSGAARQLMENLAANKVKILYIAPERLSTSINNFISFLKGLNVS